MPQISEVRSFLNEIPESQLADSTIEQEINRAIFEVNDKYNINNNFWKEQVVLAISSYNCASIALLYDKVKVGDLGYSFSTTEYLNRLRERVLSILKKAGIKNAKVKSTPMFDPREKDPYFSDTGWLTDYEGV